VAAPIVKLPGLKGITVLVCAGDWRATAFYVSIIDKNNLDIRA
jgi:hypothetical protein